MSKNYQPFLCFCSCVLRKGCFPMTYFKQFNFFFRNDKEKTFSFMFIFKGDDLNLKIFIKLIKKNCSFSKNRTKVMQKCCFHEKVFLASKTI